METNTKKLKPVTIYTDGVFGIQKIEAHLLNYGNRPYAQYANAPFVNYIPKGKRKPVGWIKGYRPYLIIIAGHGHPDPQPALEQIESSQPGVTVSRTRHSAFSGAWAREFDDRIDAYLKENPSVNVLFQVRDRQNSL